MFRHVVLFRWTPEATPEQVDAVAPALRALAGTLPGLISYECGPSLQLAPANGYDFGVVAAFEDRSGWDAYMADPEHDRIRAEIIGPIAAERATIQLEA